MADISKITLPSGSTYDVKDTLAREMAAGTIHLIEGSCSTALTDMATTNPITINGESYTAKKGEATFYESKEFVFDGTYWHEFGDNTGLGDLAFKDSASGTFTPAGTVSQPTFTGTQSTIDVDVTPSGTVSKPDITVTKSTDSVYSITDVGTLPVLTTTVANETLTIAFSQGTLPTKGAAQTVMTNATAALDSAPVFTGTEATFHADVTPEGTVSQPTFTGTQGNVTVS